MAGAELSRDREVGIRSEKWLVRGGDGVMRQSEAFQLKSVQQRCTELQLCVMTWGFQR